MLNRVFDHSIYLDAALSQTAEAYSELCAVSLDSKDGATTATFGDLEDTMLMDAFSNHALFLSIQAYRGGGDA